MQITLKQIGYGVIFLLTIGIGIQTYRVYTVKDTLKSIRTEQALVESLFKHKQDSINLLTNQAVKLSARNDSLTAVVNKLSKKNKDLDKKLAEALTNIDAIPASDNYTFLQDSAYVYEGDKEFPFNGKQVTEIRKSYIENNVLKRISIDNETFVEVLRKQIGVQDSMISNQYERLDIYQGLVKDMTKTISMRDLDNVKLQKDIDRQRKITFALIGATAAETATLLLIILL